MITIECVFVNDCASRIAVAVDPVRSCGQGGEAAVIWSQLCRKVERKMLVATSDVSGAQGTFGALCVGIRNLDRYLSG